MTHGEKNRESYNEVLCEQQEKSFLGSLRRKSSSIAHLRSYHGRL